MKYSVEFENGVFTESLTVDGHTVTKTWKRRDKGTITGLCTGDKDFSEQLEELLDEETCDNVYGTFDNLMLVADMEDFIMMNNVE